MSYSVFPVHERLPVHEMTVCLQVQKYHPKMGWPDALALYAASCASKNIRSQVRLVCESLRCCVPSDVSGAVPIVSGAGNNGDARTRLETPFADDEAWQALIRFDDLRDVADGLDDGIVREVLQRRKCVVLVRVDGDVRWARGRIGVGGVIVPPVSRSPECIYDQR